MSRTIPARRWRGWWEGVSSSPKPYTRSGLREVFAGEAAADYFKVRPGNERVLDVFGISQYRVVYTGKKRKVAEHGGANPQDLDVPLVVSGHFGEHGVNEDRVKSTQICAHSLEAARPPARRSEGGADRAHAGLPLDD